MGLRGRPERKATCHPDRRHEANGLCKQCWHADYYKQNKSKLLAKSLRWQQANPEKHKAANRKSRYGLSAESYAKMLKTQAGKCAICKTAPATDIDHNHKSGKVRGLLCGNCNRAIGLLHENPTLMVAAANYMMSQ